MQGDLARRRLRGNISSQKTLEAPRSDEVFVISLKWDARSVCGWTHIPLSAADGRS
jgi:hypothetical protein